MSFSPIRRRLMSALLALAAVPAAWAQGPAYPSRPVTVIVPFAAGGSVDAAARLVLQRLGERMKQTFVIENVAGAAGTIGTLRAVRAPADGYTLLFAVASPITVAPLVSPALVKYDALRDLAPVAQVASSPFVLVGSPRLAANGTGPLLALARQQAGKLSYGTDGVGTSMHVTVSLIEQQAGVELMHVPYRSGPQVLTELASGLIDLAVMPVTLAQPFIKDGKVKAYGVTSRQRWASLPAVPALAETPELKSVAVESWYGLFAPAATDAALVDRLSREVAAALAEPELQQRLTDAGLQPAAQGPAQFAATLKAEKQALGAVVAKAGIKTE